MWMETRSPAKEPRRACPRTRTTGPGRWRAVARPLATPPAGATRARQPLPTRALDGSYDGSWSRVGADLDPEASIPARLCARLQLELWQWLATGLPLDRNGLVVCGDHGARQCPFRRFSVRASDALPPSASSLPKGTGSSLPPAAAMARLNTRSAISSSAACNRARSMVTYPQRIDTDRAGVRAAELDRRPGRVARRARASRVALRASMASVSPSS